MSSTTNQSSWMENTAMTALMDVDAQPRTSVKRLITDEECNIARPLIERLYIIEKKTFDFVAAAVCQEYGFKPTVRQFNRKVINGWGLGKYKVNGLDAATRKQQKLDLRNQMQVSLSAGGNLSNIRSQPVAFWREGAGFAITETNNSPLQSLHSIDHRDSEFLLQPLSHSGLGSNNSTCGTDARSTTDQWMAEVPAPTDHPELTHLLNEFHLSELVDDNADEFTIAKVYDNADEDYVETSFTCVAPRDLDNQSGEMKSSYARRVSDEGSHKVFVYIRSKNVICVRDRTGIETIWTSELFYNSGSLDFELYPFVDNSPTTQKTDSSSRKPLLPIEFYEEKLEKLLLVSTPHDFATISTMVELANQLCDRGEHQKEEPLRRYIIESCTKAYGENASRTLEARLDFISVMDNKGHFTQAATEIREVRELVFLHHPNDDYLIMRSLGLSGRIAHNCFEFEEAAEWARRCLYSCLILYGSKDEQTVTALFALGQTLRMRKNKSQATKLLRMASQLSTSFQMNTVKRLNDLACLALVLQEEKNLNESTTLIEFILTKLRAATLQSMESLRIMYYYVLILRMQGKYERCLKISRQVLPKCRLKFGKNHWLTINFQKNMALAIAGLGNNAEATIWFAKSLSGYNSIYGSESEDTLRTCLYLGDCYEDMGQFVRVLTLYWTCLSRLRFERLRERGERYAGMIERRFQDLQNYFGGPGVVRGLVEKEREDGFDPWASDSEDEDDYGSQFAAEGRGDRSEDHNPLEPQYPSQGLDDYLMDFCTFPEEAEDKRNVR